METLSVSIEMLHDAIREALGEWRWAGERDHNWASFHVPGLGSFDLCGPTTGEPRSTLADGDWLDVWVDGYGDEGRLYCCIVPRTNAGWCDALALANGEGA